MLDARLAGDVPNGVFADWCEEQDLAFPRRGHVPHRSSWFRRVVSGSASTMFFAGRFYLGNGRAGSAS